MQDASAEVDFAAVGVESVGVQVARVTRRHGAASQHTIGGRFSEVADETTGPAVVDVAQEVHPEPLVEVAVAIVVDTVADLRLGRPRPTITLGPAILSADQHPSGHTRTFADLALGAQIEGFVHLSIAVVVEAIALLRTRCPWTRPAEDLTADTSGHAVPSTLTQTDLAVGAEAVDVVVDNAVAVVVEAIAELVDRFAGDRIADHAISSGVADQHADHRALAHARVTLTSNVVAVVYRSVAVIVDAVAGLYAWSALAHAEDRAANAAGGASPASPRLLSLTRLTCFGLPLVDLSVAVVVEAVAQLRHGALLRSPGIHGAA